MKELLDWIREEFGGVYPLEAGVWWFRVGEEVLCLASRPLPLVPGRIMARVWADLALGSPWSPTLAEFLVSESSKMLMAHLGYEPLRRAVVAKYAFMVGECGKLGFLAAVKEIAGVAEAKSFEVARRFGGKTPKEFYSELYPKTWEEGEDEIWE